MGLYDCAASEATLVEVADEALILFEFVRAEPSSFSASEFCNVSSSDGVVNEDVEASSGVCVASNRV